MSGADWPEMLEWIERNLAYASSPRPRQLTAFELARQVSHLPTPIPDAARRLLGEFGLGASEGQ